MTPLLDGLTAAASAAGIFALYASLLRQEAGAKPALLQFLEAKPLVFVGMWAYSLYLTHYVVLDFWHAVCTRSLGFLSPSLGFMIYLVGGISLCLAFAYAFFLGAEKPFLKKMPTTALLTETQPAL